MSSWSSLPGLSASAGRSAIENVVASYPNATLMDQVQYKAQQANQVNQLLNLVYGLLALAVVIALIGIANTLALSIHERTRELGLLRAVGTTRGQLRWTVCLEALIISLFGAIEGLVLGTLLGWAIVAAMRSQGVTHLVFPVWWVWLALTGGGRAGRRRGRDRAQQARCPARYPAGDNHRVTVLRFADRVNHRSFCKKICLSSRTNGVLPRVRLGRLDRP